MKIFATLLFMSLFILTPASAERRGRGHNYSHSTRSAVTSNGAPRPLASGNLVTINDPIAHRGSQATLLFTPAQLAEMKARQEKEGVFQLLKTPLNNDQERMVLAINEWRRLNGLSSLIVDPNLMQAATQAKCNHGHTMNGKWGNVRASENGFRGLAWDNWAGEYATPEDAVFGWGKEKVKWGTKTNGGTGDPLGGSGHNMLMRGFHKMDGRWTDGKFDRVGVGMCPDRTSHVAFFGKLN